MRWDLWPPQVIQLFDLDNFSCTASCVGHRETVLALDAAWAPAGEPSPPSPAPPSTSPPPPSQATGRTRRHLGCAAASERFAPVRLRLLSAGVLRAGAEEVAAPTGVLVSGAKDNEVRAWEVPSGRCLAVGVGHVGSVGAVALSRKQPLKFIVSAGADKLLKVRGGSFCFLSSMLSQTSLGHSSTLWQQNRGSLSGAAAPPLLYPAAVESGTRGRLPSTCGREWSTTSRRSGTWPPPWSSFTSRRARRRRRRLPPRRPRRARAPPWPWRRRRRRARQCRCARAPPRRRTTRTSTRWPCRPTTSWWPRVSRPSVRAASASPSLAHALAWKQHAGPRFAAAGAGHGKIALGRGKTLLRTWVAAGARREPGPHGARVEAPDADAAPGAARPQARRVVGRVQPRGPGAAHRLGCAPRTRALPRCARNRFISTLATSTLISRQTLGPEAFTRRAQWRVWSCGSRLVRAGGARCT